MMDLDELQTVQSRERQTDSLQNLREEFYADAAEYVEQLRQERSRAAEKADDPFDAPEVNRLTDDIKTAEQTVEAIYERRVGKIVKMASLAAADMPTEDDGLTREEQDLFETLVGAIENNRGHVLDVLAGEASPGAVTTSPGTNSTPEAQGPQGSERVAQEPDVDAADLMGGDDAEADSKPPAPPDEPPTGTPPSGSSPGTEESEDETPSSDPEPDGGTASDRVTVKVTADVGEIYGVDERAYDLYSDDVVSLPEANADPLVERGAAERVGEE